MPKLIKKLGSLNWDCGDPVVFLTVHLPLLARKPLWLRVRQSQGVNQAGNELLLRFVAFWLHHFSELADHPAQGVGTGLPIEVNEIGGGRWGCSSSDLNFLELFCNYMFPS